MNRAAWDVEAASYAAGGETGVTMRSDHGGIRGLPEAELRILPDVAGLDLVELGCGTAHVSAWLVRRGARVVGFDNSGAQLATARRLRSQHGLDVALVHADGELTPSRDASVDVAVCEFGVCLWCDPCRWVPEAARQAPVDATTDYDLVTADRAHR